MVSEGESSMGKSYSESQAAIQDEFISKEQERK